MLKNQLYFIMFYPLSTQLVGPTAQIKPDAMVQPLGHIRANTMPTLQQTIYGLEPLDEVKNRSFEFGARGDTGYSLMGIDHNLNWTVTAFAGRNYNDIIFIGGSTFVVSEIFDKK